jgi:ribosomal subunit interface protein
VDIIFKGRHTDVLERFRRHATAKLSKIARLDSKAIRVDVEVSKERNPRQSGRRERVELTISSRGPAIRAEAAAEDRFTALDMAFAKLESRLRRAGDRRKCRHAGHQARSAESADPAESAAAAELAQPAGPGYQSAGRLAAAEPGEPGGPDDDVIAIPMEGAGPLVVREKFHGAAPMTVDQALFEMELVGHDFFLFRDSERGDPSVVYRRRGYQYGVLRLVEQNADHGAAESFLAAYAPPEAAAGRNGAGQNGTGGRRGAARRAAGRGGKAGRAGTARRRGKAGRNGRAAQEAGSRGTAPVSWPAGTAIADQEAG